MTFDEGSEISMFIYAYMLSKGDGIPSDKKETTKYYKMAINKGNTSYMLNYAIMLYTGDGISVDIKETAKY